MKRLVALLLGAAIVIAGAVPALALSSSDTATLSLEINEAITFTFNDDTCDLGPSNPGTTTEQLDCLEWNVYTNAPGWTLEVFAGSRTGPFAAGTSFAIRRGDETGLYTTVGANGTTVSGAWESGGTGQSGLYTDDVRGIAGSNQAAGTISQVLTYTASTT